LIALDPVLGKSRRLWSLSSRHLELVFFTLFCLEWVFLAWKIWISCYYMILIQFFWHYMLHFWFLWNFVFFLCFSPCGQPKVINKRGKMGLWKWEHGNELNIGSGSTCYYLSNKISISWLWHCMGKLLTFPSKRVINA